MKRFYKFLMSAVIMMALTVPWNARAQEFTCESGSPVTLANAEAATTTSGYIPGYSFYNYGYTEVIVLAEKLEGMGDIYSMQFKPASTTAGTYFDNCEVYLANTTAEDLATGFVQDTNVLKLVYTGSLNYTTTEWQTIVFDSVFNYTGGNLLVAVRRNHGSYSSGSSFAAYTAGAQLGRYIYQDGGSYTIGSISGGTPTATVPVYKFTGCSVPVTCARVSDYTVSDIQARSFVLSWSDALNSGATYTIIRLPDSTVIATGITDTFYLVENVTPEATTNYAFYAECGGDDVSRYTNFSVTTPPACAVITALSAVTTTGSALLSWTPSVTDPECQGLVQYRLAGDTTAAWSAIASTMGTSFTISGLAAGTQYTARVAALCSNGDTSRWQNVTFTTKTLPCFLFDPDTNNTSFVEFSTGTTATSGVFVNSSWGNTVCQSIYTANELLEAGVQAGPIYGITLGYSAAGSYAKEVSIFLGTTDQATYTGSNGMLPLTDMTQVYGPVVRPATSASVGWQNYTFDTVFMWDGESNLVLTTFVNQSGSTGTTSSGFSGYSTQANATRTVYRYKDSSPFTVANAQTLGTGNTSSYRPSISFTVAGCLQTGTCAAPAATVTGITPTEVTLSWIPGAGETSWDIEYRLASDSLWTSFATNVSDNTATITPLVPATGYVFRVVNACSDGNFASVVSATTPCLPVPLPFNEDFEGFSTGESVDLGPCWYKHYNGTTNYNYPYPSASYSYSGNNSMYFYGYSNADAGWLVLPQIEDSVRHLELSFWEYKTTTSYGTVEVGVITDPTDLSTFTAVATVSPMNTSMWEQFTMNFQNYNGPEGRIAFVDRTSSGYSYYIDDIEVTRYSTCPRPRDLMALHIDYNTAQLSWLSPDTNEHNYMVRWSTTNDINTAVDSVMVTDGTVYTLTGLTDSTQYYAWVNATCGDGENSSPVMTHFMTAPACGTVQNLNVSNITLTTAAVTWEAPATGNEVTSYTVVVTPVASTAPVVNTTTPNTYLFLTGLDTAASYTVSVATTCNTANGTAALTSFTTMENGVLGGNDGTGYTISYPYYNYSISEQLWTADELVSVGNAIDSIAFNAASAIAGRKMKIYIGNTTLTDLSVSSFVPSTDMTLVFDGTVDITAGWNWFPFNATFSRTAGQGLVVLAYDSTGSYTTFSGWIVGMSSVSSLYDYNDDNPYSTTDLSALNVVDYRPQVRFGADILPVTCAASALVVSDVDFTSISVAWSGSQDSYSVAYRALNDTNWTTVATGLTGVNTYTVTGLSASSQYYIRLTAICGTNSAESIVLATTECGDVTAPYAEDFDDYSNSYFARPCWTVGTTNSTISVTTYPYVSNLIGLGPSLRLYQGAYVAMPHFSNPLNTLQLRFQYISSDTIYPMYFGYMTDPENIQTLVIHDTLLTNDPNADYRNFTILLNDLDDEVDGYLAFYTPVQNPQNYTFIDNLIVEEIPTCKIPDSLSVASVTTTSAEVEWYAGSGIAPTGYKVYYRKYGDTDFDTVTVTTNSATLTGLDHSTTYEVAVSAVCSATDQSAVSPIMRFVTDCAPMALPYSENFDNYPVPATYATGVVPNCWNVVASTGSGEYTPQIYYSTSYAQSGAYCLRMYNFATIALPQMDTAIDALQISFHDYISSYNYGLVVGVVDSLTPNATFYPADTILVDASGSYDFTIYLAAAGISNGYIAFQNFNTGSSTYSYHYIDNVVVSLAPSCLPVGNVTAILDSASSITLDWTDPRPATAWEISYDTTPLTDPNQGTVIPVTAHPYEVTGLSDAYSYYFYIRTVCGAGDTAEWTAVGPYRCHSVNMRANQTDTLYMCGGSIYDDGGPNGAYTISQNSTVYLMPSDGSSLVSVSGYSYTESSFDYLTIYDGLGTSGTVLFRDNATPNGQSFTNLTSSTGPLTIVFHSDPSICYDGFSINVSCIADACPVSDVAIDTNYNFTSTFAAIIWEGSSANYQIEYGPAGFELGTGTSATSNTNSFMLNGLEASHNYDFYVRGLCNVSDTGLWHKLSFQTPMCDNVTIVENFDATQNQGTSSYSPIGYSFYNYSYVQTIVDASRLTAAGLSGDITAFAFNAATVAAGSQKYDNMTVYMANVSDSNLASGWILPDSTHTFVKVIDSASFNFEEAGWNIHNFDIPFVWDGTSNVLFTVVRDNGTYATGPTFVAHVDSTGTKTRYDYRDSDPYSHFNPAVDGTPSTTIGDIRFFHCGAACASPDVTGIDTAYNSITLNWINSDSTELVIMESPWNEAAASSANSEISTTGTYTFTGLYSSTTYSIGIRQICNEGLYSEWNVVNVTTLEHPCYAPTALTVSNPTLDGATLSWTPGEEGQSDFQIRVSAAGDTMLIHATETTFTLTGLLHNTEYAVAVRTICDNDLSEWSNTVTFRTADCQAVTGVAVSALTTNSATITWTSNGSSYEVGYGPIGTTTDNCTRRTTTTASYTITGLEEGLTYVVYVRSICAEGVYSDWTNGTTFTTETQGIDDVDNAGISLYPNPASSTVTLAGIEGEATVTVVDMNGRQVYNGNTANGSLTIDVNGMAQGAYFVRITGERVNAIRKLIVR